MGGVRTFLAPNLFSQYLQGWGKFEELSAVFLAVQSGKKLENLHFTFHIYQGPPLKPPSLNHKSTSG